MRLFNNRIVILPIRIQAITRSNIDLLSRVYPENKSPCEINKYYIMSMLMIWKDSEETG